MIKTPSTKYRPFQPIDLPNRQWPNRTIERAPVWCSVDLRDGNQALIEPMGPERKLRMWDTLVAMGFKEIEVGFPAASQTDFDFVRMIIDSGRIPDDVTIQVLTQARDALISRTFDAIAGARRAIVHLYNSTSEVQRRLVFRQDRQGIIEIAREGTRQVRAHRQRVPETEVVFQYSPESFTGTELDFVIDICSAVMEDWQPTADAKMIFNLPATVELASPNVYADQIEFFSTNIRDRDRFVLSIHPHNDRGCGIAATELALMAGAERVEGTLFGNGERTGNVDVVTLALNMYSQGVAPGLDVSDINALVRVAEHCTQLPVHPRHPYAGGLVFTAFSGSHQDAIKKGFAAQAESNAGFWEVPYLPIDPKDIGRTYEAVIRINSQSGKGGIAYILQNDYGLDLPRRLQIEFSQIVQKVADADGKEVGSDALWRLFNQTYLDAAGTIALIEHDSRPVRRGAARTEMTARIRRDGREREIAGAGNGPVDAFFDALIRDGMSGLRLLEYREHAIGVGADATAIAYIEIEIAPGESAFGVGIDPSIVTASLKAVVSAINRAAMGPVQGA